MKILDLVKMNYYLFCLVITIGLISCSEEIIEPVNGFENVITIDTVFSFSVGQGQNIGQDSMNYPQNIFGLPSKNGSYTIPASSANEILSLGFGGEIIVGFKDYKIIDKPGTDFVIFENAFLNPMGKIFAEPGLVSVSHDGVIFFDFQFDSLSLTGCAGLTPTMGSAKNWEAAGGDQFDLGSLGLDEISYIKIRDISMFVYNNPEHPYYDAVISGFDLDAVLGINFIKK